MRAPRIHTDAPLQAGQKTELTGNPCNHVARVLRLQPGAELVLFNGDGRDYPGVIETVTRKAVTVAISGAVDPATESPLAIELGQVVSRGDRMDYAVQKSVELGVTRIQPLTSERCEVRLKGERAEKRQRHWQQVAVSAAEQCGRARVPEVLPLMALDEWINQCHQHDQRLVLHENCDQPLQSLTTPSSLALLIGPEGGLNNQELEKARTAGFLATTFGPRTLRTETAPVTALSICQWLWGDMSR